MLGFKSALWFPPPPLVFFSVSRLAGSLSQWQWASCSKVYFQVHPTFFCCCCYRNWMRVGLVQFFGGLLQNFAKPSTSQVWNYQHNFNVGSSFQRWKEFFSFKWRVYKEKCLHQANLKPCKAIPLAENPKSRRHSWSALFKQQPPWRSVGSFVFSLSSKVFHRDFGGIPRMRFSIAFSLSLPVAAGSSVKCTLSLGRNLAQHCERQFINRRKPRMISARQRSKSRTSSRSVKNIYIYF